MVQEVFVLPVSFAQQRLWFLDQMQPGSSLFNLPLSIRINGALNVEALQQTLNEIISRHETLRTTFASVDEEPVQVISPTASLRLRIVDLGHLPEDEREAEAQRLVGEESRLPFDLAAGPLLRASLMRLSDQEHVLIMTMHHIISDGWSGGVLFREMGTLYDALAAGKPSPLAELPIQYADYAVWQRAWLAGEVLERQLAYWRERLAGAPAVLELPTDRPRPVVQSVRGAHHSTVLSPRVGQALRALSLREGATLFMTMLAAFQTLLRHYSGQEDIVLGSDVAGRAQAETEGLIGLFANHLVLRADLSGDPTFRELLARVRAVALEAYANQDIPFEKLVEALRPKRSLSYTPIFQVLFTLQNKSEQLQQPAGLTLSPVTIHSGTAKYDLTMFIDETEQSLIGTMEYSADLFDASTITRMASHFETLLGGIVARPDARLNALCEMLVENEKKQRIVEKKEREESNLRKFKSIKPKAVSVPHGKTTA